MAFTIQMNPQKFAWTLRYDDISFDLLLLYLHLNARELSHHADAHTLSTASLVEFQVKIWGSGQSDTIKPVPCSTINDKEGGS